MFATDADNMWAKQVDALLDACTDIQSMHRNDHEEDHGSPPPKSNKLDLVRCRLSCRLRINTEGGEFDCTGPVKLLL